MFKIRENWTSSQSKHLSGLFHNQHLSPIHRICDTCLIARDPIPGTPSDYNNCGPVFTLCVEQRSSILYALLIYSKPMGPMLNREKRQKSYQNRFRMYDLLLKEAERRLDLNVSFCHTHQQYTSIKNRKAFI